MKRLTLPVLAAAALAFGGPVLAAEQTVTLGVPGMSCVSCPTIVKGSLQEVEGVINVDVSFEQKTAVVTFDDAKASVEDLINATTNAGFPSQLVTQ
ncbi:MAG: mercury resistance system periplasmic binding protein MerP [Phycisphaerales bacterium]|nr:mercury resistance system periplasmic binding protein MerP [Phycisphaerales bacterium]